MSEVPLVYETKRSLKKIKEEKVEAKKEAA